MNFYIFLSFQTLDVWSLQFPMIIAEMCGRDFVGLRGHGTSAVNDYADTADTLSA